MSKLNSLEDLLVQEIKDLFSAEGQLVKALPKMAKAASDPTLKEAFLHHLEETKIHVQRLEEAAAFIDATPRGKTCKAMEGLIAEGAETLQEDGDPMVKDLALIIAAQKVEHYEIAGYGFARELASALGLDEMADLLQTTEEEESTADENLTTIAEEIISSLQAAAG